MEHLLHRLCSSAQKLFEKAGREKTEGDEEQSYVDFMKYLEVVTYVQRTDEYLKDRPFYSKLLGVSNSIKAIDQAELLQKSLLER